MKDSHNKRGSQPAQEPGEFLFKGDESPGVTRTRLTQPSPPLTNDERAILVALCAPILMADAMTPPASLPEIARVTGGHEEAIQGLLRSLDQKFGVEESPDHRRLAIDAISRGAVGLNDIRT